MKDKINNIAMQQVNYLRCIISMYLNKLEIEIHGLKTRVFFIIRKFATTYISAN